MATRPHLPEAPVPLDRYRDIIPDWTAFREAVHSPEPVTFRTRATSLPEDRLIERLREQGFDLSPVLHLPGYWRVEDGPDSVAQTLEHWCGHLHVQQAVMALPSLALGPRAGEAVLDLCSAPGGKTTHMAELMDDRGPLVAVDPKEKRLRGLLGNLYRLGHPNVIVVASDGRTLPGGATFDRVLVDAPCSAEGNLRRQGGSGAPRDRGFVEHVTDVQEALLRRALELVRPGGVVVYSTCTFAPEENEAVVSRVLADGTGVAEAIDLALPHAKGLASWGGETFHPGVRHAWRVYPHQMDSGGLFMIRLRRPWPDDVSRGTDQPAEGWSPVPRNFPGEDAARAKARVERAITELVHRFGFKPDVAESLGWLVRGENLWAHTAERWPLPAWDAEDRGGRWRIVSLGVRASRERPPGRETPSSPFLSRWGRLFGPDHRIPLTSEELGNLLSDQRLPVPDRPAGPVVLEWEELILGRGMVGVGGLRHELPAPSAERLRTVLDRLRLRRSAPPPDAPTPTGGAQESGTTPESGGVEAGGNREGPSASHA